MRAAALGGAVARVVGRGTVAGALYDLGEYPGVVDAAGDAGRVPGVVLELDDAAALARLDHYEGVGHGLYVRREVVVALDGGGACAAWLYVYARSIDGRRRLAAWPPD